jgi:hypothetical protein
MKSILLRNIITGCILLFFSFIIGYNILFVREGFQEGATNNTTVPPATTPAATTPAVTTAAATTPAATTPAPINYKQFAKNCSNNASEALKFVIVNKLVENESDMNYIIENTNSAISSSNSSTKSSDMSKSEITYAKYAAKYQINVVQKIADVLVSRKDDVSDYIKKENLNATYSLPSISSKASRAEAVEIFASVPETMKIVNQNMQKIKDYISARNTIPASTGTTVKVPEVSSSVQVSQSS